MSCMVAHCSHKKTDLKYHIKVEIYGNKFKQWKKIVTIFAKL